MPLDLSALRNEEIKLAHENFLQAEELIKKLEQEFKLTIDNINKDIAYYLDRIGEQAGLSAGNEVISKVEREHLRNSVVNFLQNNYKNLSKEEQEQLVNATDIQKLSRLDTIGIEMTKHVDKLYKDYYKETYLLLQSTFEKTYYKSAYNYSKLLGYKPLDGFNFRKFDVIIKENWAIDDKTLDDRYIESANRLLAELEKEIKDGLIKGTNQNDMARNLTKRVDIGFKRAKTLVTTETTRITAEATKTTIEELGTADMYQIEATLDHRTSDMCREMDSRKFKMKDYEIGVTAPPFHANCRTVIVPYFDDNIMSDDRASRDSKGDYKTVPAMSYKEWYKKYVKENKQ